MQQYTKFKKTWKIYIYLCTYACWKKIKTRRATWPKRSITIPPAGLQIYLWPHVTLLVLLASPPADWRSKLGRPRITWVSTIQQDLKHHHLMLPEAADLAQNRPLWRMMSTYGATQSWVACQKRRRVTLIFDLLHLSCSDTIGIYP